MQYITKLDKKKLGEYEKRVITEDIGKNGRVVIKLALGQDEEHNKNSIITMMKLNKRTWNQTIKNRGKIIWKNKKD